MIVRIEGREILDSRGNPTVSALCELADGSLAEASVPSGASTGSEEAKELRDGLKRYGGLGTLEAVNDINSLIARSSKGQSFSNQADFDNFLNGLDGTPDKRILGGNTLLAVSMAYARAKSVSEGKELFEYLADEFGAQKNKYKIPTPMFNILNGGKHSENNIDIQETMIVPLGINGFREKLRAGAEIYHMLKNLLTSAGYSVGLGDEGGFAPDFDKNEAVFEWAKKATAEAGYDEKKIRISTDVAASSFWNEKKQSYNLSADGRELSSKEMISQIAKWVKKFNLYSIEDGLHEKDSYWGELSKKIAGTVVVGDDLFVTNAEKIKIGAQNRLANGVIIKPNQIGTVSETLEAVRAAKKAKMKVIVSHRSGETEDSFIADLAVAVSADFIKSGAPARSERLAKYNRLSQIEDILSDK